MVQVVVGIILTFFILVIAMIMGGDPLLFVDLRTIFIVFTIPMAATLLSMRHRKTDEIFKQFGNYTLYAGWLAFLIGTLSVIRNYDFNDLSEIQVLIPSCILPIAYGYATKLWCLIGENYYSHSVSSASES